MSRNMTLGRKDPYKMQDHRLIHRKSKYLSPMTTYSALTTISRWQGTRMNNGYLFYKQFQVFTI